MQQYRNRIQRTKKRERLWKKNKNKERFPLFHSKNGCCCDGLLSLFHVAGPDSPTTKPEASENLRDKSGIRAEKPCEFLASQTCSRNQEPSSQFLQHSFFGLWPLQPVPNSSLLKRWRSHCASELSLVPMQPFG
jgi:hypothetical protein